MVKVNNGLKDIDLRENIKEARELKETYIEINLHIVEHSKIMSMMVKEL